MVGFFTLFKVSRPHVVYGTLISFCTFSLLEFWFLPNVQIVLDNFTVFWYYIFGNLAIQCQNQLTDEKSDVLNKPYLPLPAKIITRQELTIVSYISYALYGLMTLFYFGIFTIHGQLGVVAIALASWYSLPPFNLKQIPFINSMVIIICRPVIYHTLLMQSFIYYSGDNSGGIRNNSRYLECLNSFFWLQFFGVIAVCLYKDVPDIKGDTTIDHIATLATMFNSDLLYVFVVLSFVVSLWIANMNWICDIVLIVAFLPIYSMYHWQKKYAKAYLQIWNLFYLSMICFVMHALTY